MNIVHIEDFFHPDAGYQVNILSKYMVSKGHNVSVVTSEMDKIPEYLTSFFGRDDIESKDYEFEKKTGVNIIRVPLISFKSGRAIFSSVLFDIVDNLKPDILFVHGNDTLTGIRYLMKYKELKYPLIMDSHMLEMASLNKFSKVFRFCYRMLFAPIIIKNRIPIIRTQDDSYVEKCLGIPLEQCPYIPLGSDTLLFHSDKDVRKEFIKKYNIGEDDFIVLYIGKLDEAKGGKILANAFEKRFEINKKVVLVVVGSTIGQYGEEVDEIFEKSENFILRFPTQKYTDLAKFYQVSDLSVFPKQCSLSFYDAQACGLTVVSEDNIINVERLQNENGFNFKAGDIKDFRDKVLKCAKMPKKDIVKMGQNGYKLIKEKYDYEDIAGLYIKALENEYKRFQRSEN